MCFDCQDKYNKEGRTREINKMTMYENDDRPINEVTFVDNFHNLESKNGSLGQVSNISPG